MNNNETLNNQGAVNSAPKEYYEPVSSIDLKEQKVSKKSNKRSSKKSSDKNPVLSKREIELRDYIYKEFMTILGYSEDNVTQLDKKYLVLKFMGLAQGNPFLRKLSEKSFSYGLEVIARAVRSHRSELASAVRKKDFNGNDRYKINYVCKILESYLNQTYQDLKMEQMNKKIKEQNLKNEEALNKQREISANKDNEITEYEKQCIEEENKKTWRSEYEGLW